MSMELAAAVEDDVFFEDLSRRISLLITEDDDENFPVKNPARVLPTRASYSHANHPYFAPPPFFYEAEYRRETKGTGVFIPKSSMPKRKNKSRRSKNRDKNHAATTTASNTTT